MRKGLFVLVSAVAVTAVGTSASAQISMPVISEPAETNLVPVTGPYEMLGTPFSSPDAGILYSNTTETGSRFNPGTGGATAGSGVQQDVTFDDIPIPSARLGGATAVDVTKVTVGIRRAGNAPATDINLFWSSATTNVVDPDTELDVPYNVIGTQSLLPRSAAAFITEQVVFGDGSTTLFTAPLNSTLFNGFGTFLLGLQFSNGDTLNGWRLTSGADVNGNVMWIYDTDVTPEEGAYNFGAAPNPAATFYITVEGSPVPEPASLGALACVGLFAMRRRRR
jgi:hypothetical protein